MLPRQWSQPPEQTPLPAFTLVLIFVAGPSSAVAAGPRSLLGPMTQTPGLPRYIRQVVQVGLPGPALRFVLIFMTFHLPAGDGTRMSPERATDDPQPPPPVARPPKPRGPVVPEPHPRTFPPQTFSRASRRGAPFPTGAHLASGACHENARAFFRAARFRVSRRARVRRVRQLALERRKRR
jgi:hypothetical protein